MCSSHAPQAFFEANDEEASGGRVSVGEDYDGAEVDGGLVNGGVRGETGIVGGEEQDGDLVDGSGVEGVKCGCSQRSRRQGTNLLVIADYDLVNDRIVNGRLADGSSVPAEELVRLALEAKILPSIFNAKGEPLWLARRRRVASEVQRIALTVRDKGCINCDTSPLWCRAHHVNYWKNGGKTDIDNLVLVCNECHHKIHDEGWLVRRNRETGQYYMEQPKSSIKDSRPEPMGGQPRPKVVHSQRNDSQPESICSHSEPNGEHSPCSQAFSAQTFLNENARK